MREYYGPSALGSKADVSSDPPSGLGLAYAQTQDYELAVVEPSARDRRKA
jgi:hypothetical protein